MEAERNLSGKLTSLILASNKPDQLTGLFDNLESTAYSMGSFEVLVKVDEEDQESVCAVEEQVRRRPFEIRYIVTPRLEGYYSLHVAYNELWRISDRQTRFLSVITDEVRFKTTGWDVLLRKYMSFYPDDVFRVRVSDNRSRNYYSLTECFSCPENYPFVTRTWLELTEGWGSFWGPDAWHQAVEYYLGFDLNRWGPKGIFRNVPAFEIRIEGQEAGIGWNGSKQRERARRIRRGWWELEQRQSRENFLRLACRLRAHIEARREGYDAYVMYEDSRAKTIACLSVNSGAVIARYSYGVNRFVGLRRTWLTARHRTRIELERLLSDTTLCRLERACGFVGKGRRLVRSVREGLWVMWKQLSRLLKRYSGLSWLACKLGLAGGYSQQRIVKILYIAKRERRPVSHGQALEEVASDAPLK